MGPKSSVSTLALNGSASESTNESDSSVGTLQNDEEWGEELDPQEHSPEQMGSLQEYLSPGESQVLPASENREERLWADKDRGGPSVPSPQKPIDRYIGDPDNRQEFFVTGEVIKQTDIIKRRKGVSAPEERHTGGDEVRRKTVKTVKQSKEEGSKGVDGQKRNDSRTTVEKANSKNGKRNKHRAGESSRLVEDV